MASVIHAPCLIMNGNNIYGNCKVGV
ncbi:hypothetical protein HWN40_02265 [Methanolobus zinderi]|uniref:Uncharacterized protein n=1 Tax=Methanolobus zinderi TaxID=536044 RepID=A0A7D5I6D4_9EURY|nr:hypothetical protein HWN40_02265 [Methanolobus zinderi]